MMFLLKNSFIQQDKRGFSLLELLMYIAILSIIVVMLSNTFISLSKGHGQSQARSEVNNALRFATELIRQDVKNATAITTPTTGASSATMTLTRSGVTIIYDVSSGVLRRKEGAASPVDITASSSITVGTPTFTRIENTNTLWSVTDTSIRVNMTFSYKGTNPDWIYSDALQTSVSLF